VTDATLAGEGLANASMAVAETGAFTTTASAGGYRIPLDPGNYTLQATLADGRQFSRTFTIDDQNINVDFDLIPLPAIAFAADTDTFLSGDAVALTWSVNGADACTITPDIGPVDPSGSVSVHPTQTTVYTLTASGPGGTVTETLTITARPPHISFSAAPRGVAPGEPATLRWEASGADTCQIDPGIDPVACTGERIVSIEETTTYTLIASGPGGTAAETITLWIDTAPPEVEAITPTPDSGVETVNGYFDVLVTAADPVSGLCDVSLSDGSGTDMSHLLHTSGGTISWRAHTGDPRNYRLTLHDCAGNAFSVPIAFTSLDVPASVDYGPPDPAGADSVGGGIRITNGNVFKSIDITDLPTPNRLGLGLALYFNSRTTTLNSFAFGWTHTYAASLISEPASEGQTRVHIQDATGRSVFFTGDSSFQPLYNEPSSLAFHRRTVHLAAHRWLALRIRHGRPIAVDARQRGQPTRDDLHRWPAGIGVRSRIGPNAHLRVRGRKHLHQSSARPRPDVPDGVLAAFTYDDYGNLVSVTRADGSAVECFYTDGADPNNLTRLEDGSGTVLARWSYDSLDRAVESRLADDTGVTVDYTNADTVAVTDAYGTDRTYTLTSVSGTVRVTALQSGPALSPYHPRPAVKVAIRRSTQPSGNRIRRRYPRAAPVQHHPIRKSRRPRQSAHHHLCMGHSRRSAAFT
jgi:YD repeat-containing protein